MNNVLEKRSIGAKIERGVLKDDKEYDINKELRNSLLDLVNTTFPR